MKLHMWRVPSAVANSTGPARTRGRARTHGAVAACEGAHEWVLTVELVLGAPRALRASTLRVRARLLRLGLRMRMRLHGSLLREALVLFVLRHGGVVRGHLRLVLLPRLQLRGVLRLRVRVSLRVRVCLRVRVSLRLRLRLRGMMIRRRRRHAPRPVPVRRHATRACRGPASVRRRRCRHCCLPLRRRYQMWGG